MGIRCYCPNGHKLNLKSHLAGKVGVCPKCNIQFPIPEQSDPALEQAKARERAERRSSRNGSKDLIGSTDAAAPPTAPHPPTTPKGSAPVKPVVSPPATGTPAAKRSEGKRPAASTPTTRASAPAEPERVPSTPADRVPATSATDRIGAGVGRSKPSSPESGTKDALVWYVRPPSGGEYGPATDEDFQNWLAEGRITPDSYVWFTGWPDWKQASAALPKAFPNVSTSAVPTVATSGTSTSTSAGPVVIDDAAAVRVSVDATATPAGDPVELYRRKKSTKMTMTVIIVLSLACAVLLAGLVWALKFRS